MNIKETEKVELKKSTSELKEAVISITAILNKHKEGTLYFGIKNNGDIIGQTVSEKTIRDISKSISDNIEPKIYPKITEIRINDKTCINVEFKGDDSPYFAYGRGYMRIGDEDKKISAKEIERIILDKNKGKLSWDKSICNEAKADDISSKKLKDFLKKAGLKFDSKENSLKKLGLISRNKLLNAAVIIFSKFPEKFFPNARLRCAVFGTNDTSFTIDMQEFAGDLFFLIEKAEEYILKNIHIGMKVEGLRRIDVPEINKEAFREAVINAFCHRDYYLYDSVNIAIFKNRVEIRSPGLLYGDLTIDKIKRENVSERRNELIAEMFHKVHFMEKWGRGISLILFKEPSADFKEVGRQFIAVFKRKAIKSEKTDDVVSEGVSGGVSEGVNSLIQLIKTNPGKRIPYFEKMLKVPKKTLERWIRNLKKGGKIEFKGSPKTGGYWRVVR